MLFRKSAYYLPLALKRQQSTEVKKKVELNKTIQSSKPRKENKFRGLTLFCMHIHCFPLASKGCKG